MEHLERFPVEQHPPPQQKALLALSSPGGRNRSAAGRVDAQNAFIVSKQNSSQTAFLMYSIDTHTTASNTGGDHSGVGAAHLAQVRLQGWGEDRGPTKTVQSCIPAGRGEIQTEIRGAWYRANPWEDTTGGLSWANSDVNPSCHLLL